MIEGLRQIPVKVYRSTDTNAPVLQGVKGSLKTLLKACLVTGYGDKDPLGWAMPFEDTNRAAFQSKEDTSNKHYLWVDHDSKQYVAQVAGAMSMTSLDDLIDPFGRKYTAVAYQNYKTPWVLIGHEKSFVLLMLGTCPNQVDQCGNMIYFGDVPSFFAGDVGTTLLMANDIYNDSGFSYANPSYTIFNKAYMAMGLNTQLPVVGSLSSPLGYKQIGSSFDVLGTVSKNTSQIIAFTSYIRAENVYRAMLPGIFIPSMRPELGIGDVTYPGLESFVRCPVCEPARDESAFIFVNKQYWLGI